MWFFSCAFAFCSFTSLVSLFRWLEHNGCCVCFFVFFFVPDVFLLVHRNCFVCSVNLFQKLGIWSLFRGFPWKKECFKFNHSLGCLPYSIYHHKASRLSLSFQLADLLSPFIIHQILLVILMMRIIFHIKCYCLIHKF